MNNIVSKKQASELFISQLIERAYHGAIQDVLQNLENGPPGRRAQERLIILHNWYIGLPYKERDYVRDIIRDAVDSAVFGALVLLDGLTGGDPIEGTHSDFALYLQLYKNLDAKSHGDATEMIRLNSLGSNTDLHDLLRILLQQSE